MEAVHYFFALIGVLFVLFAGSFAITAGAKLAFVILRMNRPSNAEDREIADYVCNLPVGRHSVDVHDTSLPHPIELKTEGGMSVKTNGRLITFILGCIK